VPETTCKRCPDSSAEIEAPTSTLPEFASARAMRAAETAAALYDDGYFCGEAVLTVVNALSAEPLPASVMRLGSGFCEGMGGAGCTCGALAAGVMGIGLFAGRESATDPWEPSFFTSGALHDRFRATFKASCCRSIVRPFGGMEGVGRHEHCAVVTGTAAGWVVEIAEQQGWL
jgi:C_GCAxxG_C_C family probable redox protein